MGRALLTMTLSLTLSVYVLGQIVITEVMYNPPESGTDSLEYIEFYNTTTSPIDMSGYVMAQGVTFTFPSGTMIGAEDYLVIAFDSAAIAMTFGYTGALQWTSGGLSNGGESIVLNDNLGTQVDMVSYDDGSPWPDGSDPMDPASPDGGGPSIELSDPTADNNDGSNWFVSNTGTGVMINGSELYGTPGTGVVVSSHPMFTDSVEACDSFTWFNGTVYDSTGQYLDTVFTGMTIDSIGTLVLHINLSQSIIDTVSACDSFEWIDGVTYMMNTTGVFDTLTSSAGCDSIVELNLTIQDTMAPVCAVATMDTLYLDSSGQLMIDSHALDMGSMDNCGIVSITLDQRSFTCADVTGLPSGVMTDLFISEYIEGSSSNKCIELYNGTGAAVDLSDYALERYNNGSSTPSGTLSLTGSLADGATYVICDDNATTTFTSLSDLISSFPGNFNGDDAIVLLNNGVRIDIFGEIGVDPGSQWVVNGIGTADQTLVRRPEVLQGNAVNGAGFPTLGTEWIEHPANTSSELGSHMINTPPTATGLSLTQTVTDLAGNTSNCMSTVFVIDTFVRGITQDTINACDSYMWIDGVAYTSDTLGVYDTLISSAGCDSIIELVLTIDESASITDTINACDSYIWIDGMTYMSDTVGVFDTLVTSAGCDSIVELVLTIHQSVSTTDSVTTCGSHTWIDGMTYTMSVSGVYDTLTTTEGCDSVVELVLTLNSNITTVDEVSACDSFEWIDGVTYTMNTTGVFDTLTSVAGCDSIVELNLTIQDTMAPICAVMAMDTLYLDVSGQLTIDSHSLDMGSMDNCEIASITLNQDVFSCVDITELPTSGVTDLFISEYIEGSSSNKCIELYNGTGATVDLSDYTLERYNNGSSSPSATLSLTGVLNEGATYVICDNNASTAFTSVANLLNSFPGGYNGDDAIVLLNNGVRIDIFGEVGVDPGSAWSVGGNRTVDQTLVRRPEVLQGNAVNGAGFPTLGTEWIELPSNTSTELGSHMINTPPVPTDLTLTQTVTDLTGNTSTCMSAVFVLDTFDRGITQDTITACNSYMWIDGVTYTSDTLGVYDTLISSAGCDSIIELVLTIDESASTTDTITACDSYIWIDGMTYMSDTVGVFDTLVTSAGCDSIVELVLTIHQSVSTTDSVTTCGSHTWIDGMTYTMSTSGVYDTLITSAGCDSVVELVLTFNSNISTVDEVSACDSFEWIDGVTYTMNTTGVFDTLTSVAGCDSIVELNLTIQDTMAPVCAVATMDTLYLGASGQLMIDSHALDVGSMDNCGIASITLDQRSFTCADVTGLPSGIMTDLFISEYVEGSSSNKCIELYNGTGAAVDLSDYALERYNNGSSTPSGTLSLTGSLADGATYVICDDNASTTFTSLADLISSFPGNFNGDDAIVLLNNGVRIDIFGEVGVDPGSAWSVGGNRTADQTLVRRPDVLQGNMVNGAGFPTLGTEWIELPSNTSSELGSHTLNSPPVPTGLTLTQMVTDLAGNTSTCMSMVFVLDTVDRVITEDSITACDSYMWIDGMTYTSDTLGVFDTLVTASGCDSIVELVLTIHESASSIDTISACDSYMWIDGMTYTSDTVGIFDTLVTAAGCDSIVELVLTIHQSTSSVDTITACDNYTWIDGLTYTSDTVGVFDTLATASGCDSIVELVLTIHQSATSMDTITACDNYTWIDGQTYTSDTVGIFDTLVTAAGCDSIIELVLTIHQSTSSVDTITACDNYTWVDGMTYTSDTVGIFDTLVTAAGCDSIVELMLTIHESTFVMDTVAACDNYTWVDGMTYTSDTVGIFDTLVTAAGCDSIVELVLTIHESASSTDAVTACDSYMWIDGVTYTSDTAGIFDTLVTAAGCDSIVELVLTIHESAFAIDTVAACYSYMWIDGVTYTNDTAGVFDTLVTSAGCDSIVELSLTIHESVSTTDSVTSCVSFTWINGMTYTMNTSGVYDTLVTATGCDSIIELVLTLNNDISVEDLVSACDRYVWIDGMTYTTDTTGVFDTLTSVAGCDSIVELVLTIHESASSIDTITACDNFTWIDGMTYTMDTTGVFDTLTSVAGCDSIVELVLTIQESASNIDTITACDNYTWIDGMTYTSDTFGIFDTLVTASGCDSIVELVLTIHESASSMDTVTACDNYTWIDGMTYTSDTVGIFDTLVTALGCDSIVELVLTIHGRASSIDTITACDNYTWIDGMTYTSDTVGIFDTLATAAGCDSIVELVLTIHESAIVVDTVGACDSYIWIDGMTYTSDTVGIFDTLVTASGCDSIVELVLTIHESASSIDTITACDNYTWIDGMTYTSDTVGIFDTLVTAAGCDSIVELVLTIHESAFVIDTVAACDSFIWIDGMTYTSDTVGIFDTLTTVSGCDSIVELHLTVTDTTAPICNTVATDTLYLSTTGFVTLDSNALNNGSTDDCAIASITISQDVFSCADVTGLPSGMMPDLFISEYIEGSSNNKCLELYNGTGATVDLSDYTLERYNNGNSSPSGTLSLTGSLVDGETYVICDDAADPAFTVAADLISGFTSYNGDDAIVLLNNGVRIDIFGEVGVDPGSQWSVNGIGTANQTLERKPEVLQGNAVNGAGFPTLGTEWIEHPSNTSAGLGTHSVNASPSSSGLSVIQTVTDVTGNFATCTTEVFVVDTIDRPIHIDSVTACDSYTWIDGVTYTSSTAGIYDTSLLTTGCDSIIELRLTILNSSSTIDSLVTCDSLTWIDGVTYSSSTMGVYDTLTNVQGCDSIIELRLTVFDTNTPVCNIVPFHIVYLDSLGQASLDSHALDNGSTDPCGISSITISQDAFDCGDITSVPPASPVMDLFISEYVEGSSFNKCIELYNGTGGTVDLSNYTIEQYNNGATTATSTINLAGLLDHDETYVICHTSSDPSLLAIADETSSFVSFNGDDAIVLLNNGTQIDFFGEIGVDPGSQWSVGGNTTAEQTLVRNPTILNGNTINGAGFPSLGTEWTSFSQNTFDDLGSHTISLPTFMGGITVTQTVTNLLGSSSSCETSVFVLDSFDHTPTIDSVEACDGYTWIDGVTYMSDTVGIFDTLANSRGCDSIIELRLTIHRSVMYTDSVVACDSYTWIDGVTYTSDTSGIFDTLVTSVGCDSIVTLWLDLDEGAPVITCPADTIVSSVGLDDVSPIQYPAIATDDRGVDSMWYDEMVTSGADRDTILRTWYAIDTCGQMDSCSHQIIHIISSNLDITVLLSGAYSDSLGAMETKLHDYHLLPGQDPQLSTDALSNLFGTPTPQGQPYSGLPWNHTGAEGDAYADTTIASGANVSPYDSNIVDWVLLSVRRGSTSVDSTVWTCAALLSDDGQVTIPQSCGLVPWSDMIDHYIVVEHRNHIPTMSDPVQPSGGSVSYDFTASAGWTSGAGIIQEVNQVMRDGKYMLYSGNADQSSGMRGDINVLDYSSVLTDFSSIRKYTQGDCNLDGDVNIQDIAQELYVNLGLFSLVF